MSEKLTIRIFGPIREAEIDIQVQNEYPKVADRFRDSRGVYLSIILGIKK